MSTTATFEVNSRDIQHQELALEFIEESKDADSSYRWSNKGDSYQFKKSKERQDIIDCLSGSKTSLTPKEIAETIDKTSNAVTVLLRKMLKDGEIIQDQSGKYRNIRDDEMPF